MSAQITNHYGAVPAEKPRKKRRIFLWFFLAVQLLFVLWIGAGLTTVNDPNTCDPSLSQSACDAAAGVGAGLALTFMIGSWMVVDFLLGVIYGVYRLAKRT